MRGMAEKWKGKEEGGWKERIKGFGVKEGQQKGIIISILRLANHFKGGCFWGHNLGTFRWARAHARHSMGGRLVGDVHLGGMDRKIGSQGGRMGWDGNGRPPFPL